MQLTFAAQTTPRNRGVYFSGEDRNVRLGCKKSGHVSVAAFGVSFETALSFNLGDL
jgi:hypothetical protein